MSTYKDKYIKYKKKYLRLQNGGTQIPKRIENRKPKFSVGDIVIHSGKEAKILSSKRMFKLTRTCNIEEERIVEPKSALKHKSLFQIQMDYKSKNETGVEYYKKCDPIAIRPSTESGYLTDIFITYNIELMDTEQNIYNVHEDDIKEKKQIPHLEFKRESKEKNIDKYVKVETDGKIALLPLYKVGVEVLMGENSIIAYKLKLQYKQDKVDYIYISDVPALKNYTFKVRFVPREGKDDKYYLTRLS